MLAHLVRILIFVNIPGPKKSFQFRDSLRKGGTAVRDGPGERWQPPLPLVNVWLSNILPRGYRISMIYQLVT